MGLTDSDTYFMLNSLQLENLELTEMVKSLTNKLNEANEVAKKMKEQIDKMCED